MALSIRDTSVVPDGGWRYPHVVPNQFIVAPYQVLYDEIVKVYTSNNRPVPSKEEVLRWHCENLVVSCYDDETHEPLVNLFTQGLPAKLPVVGCCQ